VTRLFDLTRDVLLTTGTAGAIDALARHVARRFELSRIAICLRGDGGWRIHQGGADELPVDEGTLNGAFAKARGMLEFDARQRAYGGHVRVRARRRRWCWNTCSTASIADARPRTATFGTGMGLSITHGLLSAAGGRIWAENVPGGGARFSLVVPGPICSARVAS
jgi:hypothetical protein